MIHIVEPLVYLKIMKCARTVCRYSRKYSRTHYLLHLNRKTSSTVHLPFKHFKLIQKYHKIIYSTFKIKFGNYLLRNIRT